MWIAALATLMPTANIPVLALGTIGAVAVTRGDTVGQRSTRPRETEAGALTQRRAAAR